MKSMNDNFAALRYDYLFPLINLKIEEYKSNHKNADIINLGEVTPALPLCQSAVSAVKKAIDEIAVNPEKSGYVPAQGFDFLRESVCRHYAKRGVCLSPGEVFIGNGIKDDISNILDIFGPGKTAVIPNPVYPVYLDASIMSGHKVVFVKSEGDDFLPAPDYNVSADIIYICSPSSPSGTAYFTEPLRDWVAYALDNNAVILFDAAFASFIRNDNLIHSIYEIEGASYCAVEFCSFSKSSGFEGLRCGYTIIPNGLKVGSIELNPLWKRRQETKFGGVPYIIQRGAEAVLSDEGQAQIHEHIDYYLENAQIMRDCLSELGIWACGGKNSPFVWMKCPGGTSSWEFFRMLLEKAEIVAVPGCGFGDNGEGYMRISSFADRQTILKATARFKQFIKENF